MATITVVVDQELDAAIHTISGVLEYEEIRDAINTYYRGTLTKYTIWDFSSSVVYQHISVGHIQQLADQVTREGKARRGCYDLVIGADLFQYGMLRMYTAYTEVLDPDAGSLKTIPFRKKDDAVAWIREHVQQYNKPK